MKKISKEPNYIINSPNAIDRPQGTDFWRTRKINDKERDWLDRSANWVKGYTNSLFHPHRELILKALKKFKFGSLLEVGCNAGPNLMRIQMKYPKVELAGIDVNEDSLIEAKKQLSRKTILSVGSFLDIPLADKSVDVVLCDAVLMYAQPSEVAQVMNELERVARKGIIIVDRFLLTEGIAGHVWARDYGGLLRKMNYSVTREKITKKSWPTSKNWQKYGYIWIAKNI